MVVDSRTAPDSKAPPDSRAAPFASKEFGQGIRHLIKNALSEKKLRRGANEVTKSLNKGKAELVVLAADAQPLEILLHIPSLCEDKDVKFIFIDSMQKLARACGISRPVIAASIISDGSIGLKTRIEEIKRGIAKYIN